MGDRQANVARARGAGGSVVPHQRTPAAWPRRRLVAAAPPIVAAIILIVGAGSVHAADPSIIANASAVPSASCQQADVTLAVSGSGDPVVQPLPLDVMIVFDRSGSMDDEGGSPPQPITSARNAAKALVDSLKATDRAALTVFNDNASLTRALTFTLADVKSSIDAISVTGNTNIAAGVQVGQQHLAGSGRSAPTVRAMVVLSDGVANRRTTGGGCSTTPTAHNQCTQDAINKAAAAKAAGTHVFTIGLNLNNLSSATRAIARDTLQQMASNAGSYFESPTTAQLEGVFAQIASILSTLAGSNVVVTHVLPSGVSYVSGSAVPAPVSVIGPTLTWNLGIISIDSNVAVTFRAAFESASADQAVGVVPSSRVDYADHEGNPATVAFPSALVSVEACATATPVNTGTATRTPTHTSTPLPSATPTSTVPPSATPTVTATATPVAVCGDAVIEGAETCDDGNTFDGDGCDSTCTISTTCNYTAPGTPTEWFVGACGAPSHATVAEAMAAAAAGDVITLCAGAYTDPIVVSQEVTLRAAVAGAATLQVASGPAIDVRRSGVRIEGLVIRAESGAAITADAICPLGLDTCGSPGRGSNLVIVNNEISGPLGIVWHRQIDCAAVIGNTLRDLDAAVILDQQDGTPAILVKLESNTIQGGGGSGRQVRVAGFGPTIAANLVERSQGSGIEVGAVPAGVRVVITENDIRDNQEGITIRSGGGATRIVQNNITFARDGSRHVGLGNEAPEAVVDATLNWWNSSSGPHRLPDHPVSRVYAMAVEERGALGTAFIEFLCSPAPAGFPSVLGVCDGAEVQDVDFVAFGRSPDVSPNGRFVTFVSDRDVNGDVGLGPMGNTDQSDEVFVLNRKPGKRSQAHCLGGATPGLACNRPQHCIGLDEDPLILQGTCALITQASNDQTGVGEAFTPRATLKGDIVFVSTADLAEINDDASREIYQWQRAAYRRKPAPVDPNSVVNPLTGVDHPSSGHSTRPSEAPSVNGNGRFVFLESEANLTGANGDHNREIFWYDVRLRAWEQVTDTIGVENRRPATTGSGRQVLFDSTSDFTGGNADGNRELFLAQRRAGTWVITQLTDTVAPDENHAGGLGRRGKVAVFSSNADLVGRNADRNREIFAIDRGAVEQLTETTGGADNANPQVNPFGRFVVFESTAVQLAAGDTPGGNRRVYLFDRRRGTALLISRSTLGDNFSPRISKGRFVVWESTANLTGENPTRDRVIYMFDRRRDD